ncbi:MAG: hypothetical protein RL638_526 [Bacteroidota bacterium]|jgi:hypothetical protein
MRYISLILLWSISLNAWGQFRNKSFNPSIKSIYIGQMTPREIIQAQPVFDISNQIGQLNFDDLSLANRNGLFLRVVHCQADWTASPLSDIEFLQDFNDVPVRDSQASMGTKVPYRHYQIALPRVKLAGNYLVMVYNRAKRDTLLTQRFCVYNNEITVASQIRFGRNNALRNTHHNLDIKLKYPGNYMINSAEDFKVYVKQNEILENQLPKLPLGIIEPMSQSISFPSYENEQAIAAGNEYRVIDLRSTQQKLNFVDHWDVREQETLVYTMLEIPQGNYAYVQRNDFNGAYVIENYENNYNSLYADYVNCVFSLKAPKQNDPIYVTGAFNNYQQASQNQMQYNEALGLYQASIQMKQGIYNYRFETKIPSNFLEGNYAQAENNYEIFVYLRKPGKRYDELVGFQKINTSP